MSNGRDEVLSVGRCATLACLIEATVPKPGNVHRGADFDDLNFLDFQAAAVAIGPAMEQVAIDGLVGRAVFEATRATRTLAASNVNLGIVLLIAPLAAASRLGGDLSVGVKSVLGGMTADDAAQVYAAINLAQPGGLGKVDESDVSGTPPQSLIEAMRLAADRDSIAKQYVTDFADVFGLVVPELQRGLAKGWSLSDTVIRTHLQVLHQLPDTLIARKCGLAKAKEVAAWAGQVLSAGLPNDEDNENYNEALADLDFELRSDGHKLNPGTTADLIAAGLFVALRDRMIPLPIRY